MEGKESQADNPALNEEQQILVKRLVEAGLDTRWFLKINREKAAVEADFPKRLYTPDEMMASGESRWGICGKSGLVLVDTDRVEMADILREILPATFEVRSPRRGLPHFYYVVKGDPIQNKTLHLHGEEDGAGEVRAQNQYLVAAGTMIEYRDLRTSERRTGRYTIIHDRPIAVLSSAEFMKAIEPYLGTDKTQRITVEHMRKGVPQGVRHAMGIRFADYLIGVQRLDPDTALFEMKRWNQLCQPPMDEKDLERMVKNAVGYIASRQKPRGKKSEEKEKPKRFKVSGVTDFGCFEAVTVDGKPCFLVLSSGNFSLVETVEKDGIEYVPRDSLPYDAYGYWTSSVLDREELFRKIRAQFNRFVDVEDIWKDVWSAEVLLTYVQEKLNTVPYGMLYGDNESGKNTVLLVFKSLSYRPLYGVSINTADIYGYLEDSGGVGCILEDEIQGIEKDGEKVKVYKSGYKRGAMVPRTIITPFGRSIKYYPTFCFKACASEKIPRVKGFNERFIFTAMVEGYPQKEWTDVTKEDEQELADLRNMLLKWRMATRGESLPEIQLPKQLRGRMKELWKPILQVTHGLTIYDRLLKFALEQVNERLSTRQDTLEGHIVKTMIDILNEKDYPDGIPFPKIWEQLQTELKGKIDDKKPNMMETEEYFTVTKSIIGYRLREVLSGKKKEVRLKLEGKKDEECPRTIAYNFSREKVRRVAKKYGYELVDKLSSFASSENKPSSKDMEKVHEKIHQNQLDTPLELGKLTNLSTDAPEPDLLVPLICHLCGKPLPSDSAYCTTYEGKLVHDRCYVLKKERLEKERQKGCD